MPLNPVFTSMLNTHRWPAKLTNLIAGSLMTLAYEPFGLSLLVFPLLLVLLFHWLEADAKGAFVHVWLFAFGAILTGNCWIFFSLYFHGGSPAIFAVLIVVLLSAMLALFPASTAYLVNRYYRASNTIQLMIVLPVAWTFAEWFRGYIFTGYAWMQPGYTQIDLPLSGFAPVFGNHVVGGLVVVTSAALLAVIMNKLSWLRAAFIIGLIWISGFMLKQISWTQAAADDVEVALVQGNVPQELKWKRNMHRKTLQLYRDLTLQNKDVDVVIWPETAIPDYRHRVPAYILNMRKEMEKSNTDLLMGLFIKDPDTRRYYNSVIRVRGGEYRKRHLVPLGEYVPFRSLIDFFNRWIKIPMSDIASGPDEQELLVVAGQPVGVNICFEDAFSRDVRRDLPEATLLVNVSNDAWFDGSHQARQHHAIARMRALETGRYMLRATNTGVTSVIDPGGQVVAEAPRFETYVLTTEVTPMKGQTPYVFFGDSLVLLSGLGLLGLAFARARSASRPPDNPAQDSHS